MISLQKSTISRLLKDIKQIKKEPLESSGIYYIHDNENILKGYAMIVGSENTPYEYGYYFFEINFPDNYPHSPPKFIFKTNDGKTRFNPNFYRTGKCCVSILNTWKGEQWTSCQTLSSILITIQSLFNNKPLLNEPGINESNDDFDNYNEIIEYKNIETSIVLMLENEHNYGEITELFKDNIKILFNKNKQPILKKIKKMRNKPSSVICTSLYNMRIKVDYEILYNRFIKLK